MPNPLMCCYSLWVVNCVGLLNYKMFLLFIFWTCLAATIATALLLSSFVDYFRNMDVQDTDNSAQ